MPQLFAVIPAAGLSRRMGRPKLTLPIAGRSVISRLLEVLDQPAVTDCVVVMRKDDDALFEEVRRSSATIIRPDVDPPDMRASVEHALNHIRSCHAPAEDDGWMLIPADHPVLNRELLGRLIVRWDETAAGIVVPVYEQRRGHPTFFRWRFADAATGIPRDRGLNVLLAQFADDVVEVPVDNSAVLTDLDTPADLQRLREQFGDRSDHPRRGKR